MGGVGRPGFTGCVATSSEPRNLDSLKAEIRTYIASGAYDRDIAAVARKVSAWIETRAAHRTTGEQLTLVLDLDETLLSGWPYAQQYDFGGDDASWNAWTAAGAAPPIEPIREVYRLARRLGIEVVFLTGRQERERAGTEKNLRAIGCTDYAVLICRPNGSKEKAAVYKTAARWRLAGEGNVIIANVGDQESDLAGSFAERTFKLPDPFYILE